MGGFISSYASPVKKLSTIVYIDGFNLYYSLRSTPYKWLNLQKLIESVLEPSLHKIEKIKYFTAVPMKAHSAQKHSIYLRALKTLQNIEIILGKFKKRQVKGVLTCYQNKKYIKQDKIVTITKWEEKKSDVNISSHIVYDGCKENIDCISLLSNDTDLTTPLEFIKYRLKKKVVIITPTQRVMHFGDDLHPRKSHIELRKLSRVNLKIEEHHLKDSQFPDVVNNIKKPKSW